MNAIDEILASGTYTDRRGREWHQRPSGIWVHAEAIVPVLGVLYASQLPDQMRLLIERDQHRDECLGLWECTDHPVPRVAVIESDYGSFARNSRVYDQHSTRSEAMDAARALAVGA